MWLVSLPLVVVGSIFFAYSSIQFGPIGPFPSWLGLPLAFVITWAVGVRRSAKTGLGGRDDELVLAFATFAAMPLAMSPIATAIGVGIRESVVSTWPAIVMGLALVALGVLRRARMLVGWGVALVVSGIVTIILWGSTLGDAGIPSQILSNIVALAMVVFGVFTAVKTRTTNG